MLLSLTNMLQKSVGSDEGRLCDSDQACQAYDANRKLGHNDVCIQCVADGIIDQVERVGRKIEAKC